MSEKEFNEVTKYQIKVEVDEAYLELAGFITKATEALYNALWFVLLTEKLLDFKSATETFMASDAWRPFLDTDAGRLDVAAGLFNFAEHDAWYVALTSGAPAIQRSAADSNASFCQT